MASVWALVVAAGSGDRFGAAKQYALLAGRPVLAHAVAAARTACDGVVLVVRSGDEHRAEVRATAADRVVAGGATRASSVRLGLAAVPVDADIVVVHDAARPLAGPELFLAAIAAVREGADGAVCAVAVTDTLKRVDGDAVVATVDRTGLVAVQTPQAFRADALRRAHAGRAEATDDAALVEAAGGRVVVVPGHVGNIKLTAAPDLVVAERWLR